MSLNEHNRQTHRSKAKIPDSSVTQLHRDGTQKHVSFQDELDAMGSIYSRVEPSKPRSSRDSRSSPKTKIFPGESSKSPATKLNRDGTKYDATKLHRDGTSQSKFSTEAEYDNFMQTRQTKMAELPDEEKKEQVVWARSKMEEMLVGACNRGYSFIEVKSGFVCAKAGHYVPHSLVLKGGFYRIQSNGTRPPTDFIMPGPFFSEDEARDPKHKGYQKPLHGRHYPDVWKAWADVLNGRYDRDGNLK